MTTTTTTKTITALAQFYAELLQEPVLQEEPELQERLPAATDPDSLAKLIVELGSEAKEGSEKKLGSEIAAMAKRGGMFHLIIPYFLPLSLLSDLPE